MFLHVVRCDIPDNDTQLLRPKTPYTKVLHEPIKPAKMCVNDKFIMRGHGRVVGGGGGV